MKQGKFGFTLIELLAVVLIIAILTSVALPQYRRSIRRAEAVEALVNLRAVYDAAKRYKAANSSVPTRLRGLDVEFFDVSTSATHFGIGKFDYEFRNDGITSCRMNDGGFCFHFYYNHATLGKDALLCEIQNNSKTGKFICESMGTLQSGYYVLE